MPHAIANQATPPEKARTPIVAMQFRLRAALAAVVPAPRKASAFRLIQGGAPVRYTMCCAPVVSVRRLHLAPQRGSVGVGGTPRNLPATPGSSSKVPQNAAGTRVTPAAKGPKAATRTVSSSGSARSASGSPSSLGCPRTPHLAASGGQPIPGVNGTFRTRVVTRKSDIFLVTISEDASLSATNVFTRSDRDA